MQTRRVTALLAKTEFVPGYGMVTFDPDSKRDELREPAVPVSVIPELVQRGWIADDIEEADAKPEPAAKPAKARKPAAAAAEGAGATGPIDADAPPA